MNLGGINEKFILKILPALIVIIVFLLMIIDANISAASEKNNIEATPWHKIYLQNGQTYNVSDAQSNTSVYIDKPGTYTLEGTSSKMRLVIKSGDVNLYLKDGLSITPGSSAYVGSSTSAISVNDQGGTVKLISKLNAQIKLKNYLTAPAICKDGVKTKLIFETEDKDNPGTIIADGSNMSSCAGIGSSYTMTGNKQTGNIIFNSGTVKAYGGRGGAGIGGSNDGICNGITINGGYIYAEGFGEGAGIGAGFHEEAKNITINGGTVKAYGGDYGAAAIGGSGNTERPGRGASNITINGGTVIAQAGEYGTGIGGGKERDGKNITINGGTVKAYGSWDGNGIGAGSDQSIRSPGAGLNIRINGGTVEAYGGKYGTGIGGKKDGKCKSDITITGGTIKAEGNGSEGVDIGGKNGSTICIIGGSVLADEDNVNGNPVNQSGNQVYRTDLYLYQVAHDNIAAINMNNIPSSYGIKDISVKNNRLYIWLPKKPRIAEITSATGKDGVAYTACTQDFHEKYIQGSIKAGDKNGILYRATKIKLDSQDTEEKDGSGWGVPFKDTLQGFKAVTEDYRGHHVAGYTLEDTGTTVVCDESGKLKPNIILNDETIATDGDSKWMLIGGDITLYSKWEINHYKVVFDKNKPDGATNQVTGTMKEQEFDFQVEKRINKNEYKLKGWEFVGWFKNPDGTGPMYEDEKLIEDCITDENNVIVTLYAKWKPKTYSITFNPGDGSGDDKTQELIFDTSKPLTKIVDLGFNKEGSVFYGWNNGTLGSLYGDGAEVLNQCTISDDGTIIGNTLNAQWHEAGSVIITVTKDGIGTKVENLGIGDGFNGIALKHHNQELYEELPASENIAGVYKGAGISADTYEIYLLKKDIDSGAKKYKSTGETIEIIVDNIGTKTLDYCTAKMIFEGGDSFGTSWIMDNQTKKTDAVLLNNSEASIGSDITKAGYKFTGYTAAGNQPQWQEEDRTIEDQQISIRGKTDITAHTAPILYHVEFDSNAQGTTGTMETQDFVYGQQQKLFMCKFNREGYKFAGWTWTPQWESSSEGFYHDMDVVNNLSTNDGSTVTLYAQWTPQEYYIHYNSNGADAGLQLDLQKTFFDSSTIIQKSSQLDFTLKNYHFIGWNTEAGGTGTAYLGGQYVNNLTNEEGGTVTLWAQWEHDYYTVRYDSNGGKGFMEEDELWIDVKEVLRLSQFVRDNHSFVEWNTKKDGSGVTYKDGETVENIGSKGDKITLYAQWQNNREDSAATTGDKSNIMLFLIIALASCAVAITIRQRL